MEEQKKMKGRKIGSTRKKKQQQHVPEETRPDTTAILEEEDAFFADIVEKIRNVLFQDDNGSSVFITRNDMEKVSSSIFWSTEELELLFDELNNDGKGYLTFEEFTLGLRNHISSDNNPWNQKRKRKSSKRIAEFTNPPSIEEADADERKQFMSFMEHLGARNIFEDEKEIWKLWTKLGRDEPHLLGNLEELLAKVTSQIKEARKEKETLEMVLKKKISDHNEEVQRLYEEMEQQINTEKEKLLNESDVRNNIRSKELQKRIEVKNTEVQQLVAVQDELEGELHSLRSTQQITKTENEKLKQTNQDLEHQLGKIRDQLSEAQGCLSEMKHKMAHSHSERERKDIAEPLTISSSQEVRDQIDPDEEITLPSSKETIRDQTDPHEEITLSRSLEAIRDQTDPHEEMILSRSLEAIRDLRDPDYGMTLPNSQEAIRDQRDPDDGMTLPSSQEAIRDLRDPGYGMTLPNSQEAIRDQRDPDDGMTLPSSQEAIRDLRDPDDGMTLPSSQEAIRDLRDPDDGMTLPSSQEALTEQLDLDESITISSSQIFFQEESQKDKTTEMGEMMPELTVKSEEISPNSVATEEHVSSEFNTVGLTETSTFSDQLEISMHKSDSLFGQTSPSVTRVISIEEDPMPELFIKDSGVPEADMSNIQESSHSHYNVQTEKDSDKLMFEQIIPEMDTYVAPNDQPEISLRTSNHSKDIFPDQPTHSAVPDHLNKEDQTLKNVSVRGSDKPNQKPLQVEISQIIKAPQSDNATEDRKVQMDKKVTFHKDLPKFVNEEKKRDVQKITQNTEEKSSLPHTTVHPDHVYKILFVGNSSVGKTSFLHRVHDGSFHQGYSATVGIDCRIKTINVDDKRFALQLWDTAGQERFHSITEHFFRKADGLVIMYDVTSKDTFDAVQYWLSCITNKTQDDIIILLMGNKIDCEAEREVTTADGEKLAQEYKLLFAECSAASGICITEPLIHMARSLQKHEDDIKNNVVKLREPTEKNKSCCF
ncbi:hypothetical protein XENTR_v10005424 [Xenopus tropicalis]|uniref:Ras-related protein Rab-44 isoform X2 n=1 Tax=Xenopus tropicalis TaxID=8364 RepID=A0A8J0T113_XENTR|nr:ras-related protein Rab-44 isoform X2 [Xenopus tropicalis]KAE8622905.1 hypothetical protein XENTR_v10005424 [Xenopus tropicalis]|eukprot:XP_017947037.1 PREDICTED: ras-related protein Rab-44 [Xenopus tropicalis]